MANPIENAYGKVKKNVCGLLIAVFNTDGPTKGQDKARLVISIATNIAARLTIVCLVGLLIVWAIQWTATVMRDNNVWKATPGNISFPAIIVLSLELLALALLAIRFLVVLLNWI